MFVTRDITIWYLNSTLNVTRSWTFRKLFNPPMSIKINNWTLKNGELILRRMSAWCGNIILTVKIQLLVSSSIFSHFRRGYAETEIEAVFAKYDIDGDRVLDEAEQIRMQADLEGQRV